MWSYGDQVHTHHLLEHTVERGRHSTLTSVPAIIGCLWELKGHAEVELAVILWITIECKTFPIITIMILSEEEYRATCHVIVNHVILGLRLHLVKSSNLVLDKL